jgi:hypothetical protein
LSLDTEGWCRDLFDDLLRLNFDFITYRKGAYEPLPESDFESITFEIAGQPTVQYDLAETTFQEEGWPLLRLIAVKKKNEGQTHVLATGRLTWESLEKEVGAEDLPASEIAWWMFARWSQENWFKYMRTEYALDVLVDYSVELDDATRQVVNPHWRALDRQVASSRRRLESAQAKYARLVLQMDKSSKKKATDEKVTKETKDNSKTRARSCAKVDCQCLGCRRCQQAREVENLSAEYDRLRSKR